MVAQYSTCTPNSARFIDLTGRVFGYLTVHEPMRSSTHKQMHWRCTCRCGAEIFPSGHALRTGHAKSCGCYSHEQHANRLRTHGMRRTKVYAVWCTMHRRCKNPSQQSFKYYGARGIGVDPRWDSFEHFFADMGEPPTGMTLDRIDNEKNYGPDNCRWATHSMQSNNTRRNHYVEYLGERFTVATLAAKAGIEMRTLWARLKSGWPVDVAVTRPVRAQNAKT